MSIYKNFISVAIKDGIIVGRSGSTDTASLMSEVLLTGWLATNSYIQDSNTLELPSKTYPNMVVVGLMSSVDITDYSCNIVKSVVLINSEEITIVS